MLFQSLGFLLLLFATFGVFQLAGGRPRLQKAALLVASAVFYYAWEASVAGLGGRAWAVPDLGLAGRFLPDRLPVPYYLSLFFAVILVNYVCALAIAGATRPAARRLLLTVGIVITLFPLLWFKYAGFALDNMAFLSRWPAVDPFYQDTHAYTRSLVLPLGISFFTFQSIAYLVDVYRDPRLASRSLLDVSLFIMLFAHLIAGPIMRASELLPQVRHLAGSRADGVFEGHYFFIRGLFKKVVLADLLATVVDPVYAELTVQSGVVLGLVTALYGFQIYFDFSGYSDMAVGVGKYFGFDLRQNFRVPYLSRSPAEFWTRWHVTLMSWFRDYVYEPLGGNRAGVFLSMVLIAGVFTLSGVWHGANWTFAAWGLYHGMLVAIGRLAWLRRACAVIPAAAQVFATFVLVSGGWLLFRISSLGDLRQVAVLRLGTDDVVQVQQVLVLLTVAYLLHIAESWLTWRRVTRVNRPIQGAVYAVCLLLVVMMYGTSKPFIYFQF